MVELSNNTRDSSTDSKALGNRLVILTMSKYHSFVTFRTGDFIRSQRSSLSSLLNCCVVRGVSLVPVLLSVTREHTRWTKQQTPTSHLHLLLSPFPFSSSATWYDGRGNTLVMLSSPQYHSDVTFTTTMVVLPTVRRDSVVTEVGSVSQVPEFGLVTRAHTSWTSHKYIRLSPGL